MLSSVWAGIIFTNISIPHLERSGFATMLILFTWNDSHHEIAVFSRLRSQVFVYSKQILQTIRKGSRLIKLLRLPCDICWNSSLCKNQPKWCNPMLRKVVCRLIWRQPRINWFFVQPSLCGLAFPTCFSLLFAEHFFSMHFSFVYKHQLLLRAKLSRDSIEAISGLIEKQLT